MKPKKDLVIIVGTITLAIMMFFMVFLISKCMKENPNKSEVGITISEPEVLHIDKREGEAVNTTPVVFAEELQFNDNIENSVISYEEYCEYYNEAWLTLILHGELAWGNARENISEEIVAIAYDNAYSHYNEASNAAFEDGYNQGYSDGFGDGYRAGYLEAIEDIESIETEG